MSMSRLLARPCIAAALSTVFAALGSSLPAQLPSVGDAAPAIELERWIAWDGAPPSLASLRGRVILLEFWGTWCGPCVRAMPAVQRLHDHYRERGLTVLAISFEPAGVIEAFARANGYTMPLGSDPAKAVVTAYGIHSWPTSIVIGKDGAIAHVGTPYDAEAAVERALGLESSPAVLLTAWFDAVLRDQKSARAALERLHEKAPADFDLRAWARANGGAEPPVADGSEETGDARPEGGAVPGELAGLDGTEALRQLASVWADGAQRSALLRQIAADGPVHFALDDHMRTVYAKVWLIDCAELKRLLKTERFADAVALMVERRSPPPVLTVATKHDGLRDWCRKQHETACAMARKGIMVQRWVFAGLPPKDNDKFWSDLAVSGISTSPDKQQVTGVLLGGASVDRSGIEGFIRSQLAGATVMGAIASGEAPRPNDIDAAVERERSRLEQELDRLYGAPPAKPGRKQ